MSAHLPRRISALVVSVLVALALGTPYLYGVFAPQLVKRVGLTALDSASISMASNIGSGFGGLPAGLVIDHWGPANAILLGSLSVCAGYFALYEIYVHRIESLILICIAILFVGFGSILGFFSTLKAAQSNFPKHRGAASAFPVSSYGLSATIFSLIAALAYSDNTAGLLLFLSLFCGAVTFLGSFFVNIHLEEEDHPNVDEETPLVLDTEETVPDEIQGSTSTSERQSENLIPGNSSTEQPLTPSSETPSLRGSFSFWGIGLRTPRNSTSYSSTDLKAKLDSLSDQEGSQSLSRFPSVNKLNAVKVSSTPVNHRKMKHPLETIKERLTNKTFLTHYAVVSLISGIGQMYIYSVGFIVIAQYNYGKDKEKEFPSLDHPLISLMSRGVSALSGAPPLSGGAASLQALQVSLISIASFGGRLVSGFVSDFIHKKLHASRLWIVVFDTLILAVGQYISMVNVNNATLICIASVIIGGSYGLVFGTYPAIIADTFGTRTFSTSWGLICTGPLIVLFNLNKYFGAIYDKNTDKATGICYKGNSCYKQAFEVSFALCFVVFAISISLIAFQRKRSR